MRKSIWAFVVVISLVAACTTPRGVTPIYPAVGNPNYPRIVDSLQPTFQWEPVPGAQTYDIIVYELLETRTFWEGTTRSAGREVYYREKLEEPRHRIEMPLEPAKDYYWSVRMRRDNAVSDWAVYDYTVFWGTGLYRETSTFFIFTTPDSEEPTRPAAGT